MLTGKIAVVTGAGRGIGREIAKRFAECRATVIVNYNGSKADAFQIVKEITDAGGTAEAIQCDVSDFKACEAFARQVLDKYKRVDILVNNAGITRDNLIMRMSEKEYEDVLDINLKGAFHMIRHFSRSFLKQRSGRIINISSVSGVLGNPGQANYAASKAGLIGLTKSVARELASRNIQVNAVAPGFIETDMTKGMTEEVKKEISGRIPMGKMGNTGNVADAVVFLAGSGGDYITGQVLCVDGGMCM